MRGLAYKKKKLLLRDGNKLHVGDRYGCRAPWLAVDQSYFTKNIVGGKFGHHSVADLNAHVTALDNEKFVGLLSFAATVAGCVLVGMLMAVVVEFPALKLREKLFPKQPTLKLDPVLRVQISLDGGDLG